MQRRSFLTSLPLVATPFILNAERTPTLTDQQDSTYFIGPREGYTPHIGVLVSKLNYIRQSLVDAVEGLSKAELDYLHDDQSNTIGALLLHLAATEKYYQVETLEGRSFTEEENRHWGAASDLGDRGREEIKGNSIEFYLDALAEVREKTLQGLKGNDDEWLLAVIDEEHNVNAYWAWFHVYEHEASHRGQIAWLKGRIA